MADKRIYELTDEQASYDKDLYVQTDVSTFSNTKKIKLENIFKKTSEVDVLSSPFTPVDTFLRATPGTGVENKVSVTNLLEETAVVALLKTALGLDVSTITFSGTADSNFPAASINLEGNKINKCSSITGTFLATVNNRGVPKFLTDIDDYVSPGYVHHFVMNCSNTDIQEGGRGYIETTGKVYVECGYGESNTWVFEANPISL